MMHRTYSINYGHLADLQKTLPTNDLNKKNFHLIKYLLTTFIFFPFFSICTCSSVGLVGNFAGLPPCRVPSAIVHCNQNEAGHKTTAQSLAINSPAPGTRPLTCGVSSGCLGTRSYETTSRDQRGKIQMFFSSTGAAKFPIANHHSQINT